jgi:hypothetical protein
MPADRLQFYIQRRQKVLQEKYTAIATSIDWEYLEKRQDSLRKELIVLDRLIALRRQSDYLNQIRSLHVFKA